MERAALMSINEKKYPVRFDIEDDVLVISSSTEIGNVRDEISVDMEGKNMTIGFNPKYFLEALRVIDDEVVDIYFNSDIGPCTIKPIEGNEFAYMILPVRIKS
jgi:DNA polymerase-3 subunit beta